MSSKPPPVPPLTRREAAAMAAAALAMLATPAGAHPLNASDNRPGTTAMQIMCVIRYQIDPFKKAEFKQHAEHLITVIPNCGGHLVGYFLPHEGTNDIAWGLIMFDSLAAYEAYRVRLTKDPEAIADAQWTAAQRCILREERNFVQLVDGTFNLPARA